LRRLFAQWFIEAPNKEPLPSSAAFAPLRLCVKLFSRGGHNSAALAAVFAP
jgi:hypothetical protein